MEATRLTVQEQCGLFDGLHKAIADASRGGGQRKGQAAFNYLHSQFPALAIDIVGTDADCFYEDRVIPKFLNRLYELCNEEKFSNLLP
jgi:hypothetical protein